ncbi:hypothetical protein TNCV_3119691 [Trichonephila clavipes]|uniref:Uncharacterized protein n=1 Tax=Trichonephila clavipes TaxID=2585209 RepID=A0A8X6WAD9_TRICX|nr:hypothetical protein TNCV_3119691 [Trichonephila clavipes]
MIKVHSMPKGNPVIKAFFSSEMDFILSSKPLQMLQIPDWENLFISGTIKLRHTLPNFDALIYGTGLECLRLWVRPRPKSVDFHDAEKRQRTCRLIKRHVKNPRMPVWLGCSRHVKNPKYGFASSEFRCYPLGRNWTSKLPAATGIRLYGAALKRDISFRGMY